LSITWREVLGLLIGLAVCYGVISYALVYAPQSRQTASEQTQENSQQAAATNQQTTTSAAGSEANAKTVIVRVTGSNGESFGANYGNFSSSRTVEGVIPADYEVQVNTDPYSGDYVSAVAWKYSGDSKELKVQIIDDGKVVKEGSTTKDYGAASVRWSPNEKQAGGTTTSSTEKTKEESSPHP
jgi:hypothetical protein